MSRIIEKHGFRLVTYDEVDWHMLINNSNMLSAKKYMLNHDIKKIQLNYTAGFKQETTEFLENYSFIDEITIIPGGDININGIHFLENLKKLRITNAVKQGIHFKLFPHLRSCSIEWNAKHKDLHSCTSLVDLSIFKYQGQDLNDLATLSNLKTLKIGSSTIRSIDGIGTFEKLISLSLSYNTKLSTIIGIENLSHTLNELDLEACKAISSIEEIALLSNLEKLGINNCGEIVSIKPVANLKKLKRFDFWESTNILDGDMSSCIGIKQVAFQDRRHYNYTNAEIDKINLTSGI